jgi:hypothetical protein
MDAFKDNERKNMTEQSKPAPGKGGYKMKRAVQQGGVNRPSKGGFATISGVAGLEIVYREI